MIGALTPGTWVRRLGPGWAGEVVGVEALGRIRVVRRLDRCGRPLTRIHACETVVAAAELEPIAPPRARAFPDRRTRRKVDRELREAGIRRAAAARRVAWAGRDVPPPFLAAIGRVPRLDPRFAWRAPVGGFKRHVVARDPDDAPSHAVPPGRRAAGTTAECGYMPTYDPGNRMQRSIRAGWYEVRGPGALPCPGCVAALRRRLRRELDRARARAAEAPEDAPLADRLRQAEVRWRWASPKDTHNS
jgi:hypothetical protein